MSNAPSGWYPDPDNHQQQRYWDGSAWTDNFAPANASRAQTGGAQKLPISRRPWFMPLLMVLVGMLVGVVVGSGLNSPPPDSPKLSAQSRVADLEAQVAVLTTERDQLAQELAPLKAAAEEAAAEKAEAEQAAAEEAAAKKAAAKKAAAKKAAAKKAAARKAAAAKRKREASTPTVYVTDYGEKYHNDGCVNDD